MRGHRFVLLGLLAACGGGGGGGTLDAGPDGGAELGEVTVETDWLCCTVPGVAGQPVGGVDVVAVDPDGQSRVVTTGDDGRATLAIAPGASVTAVYRISADEATLLTFTEVADGDSLRFGDPEPPVLWATTETMRVDFPLIDNASGYDVVSSCSTAYADEFADHGEVWHTAVCDPASEDLYLYAYVGGAMAFHAELADTVFDAAGTATVVAWTPAEPFTLDATGLPDGASVSLALLALGNGDVVHSDFRDGTATGGSFAATMPWTPAADAMAASVAVLADGGDQQRVATFAPGATSHTVDDAVALPWVSGVALDFGDETIRFTLDGDHAYDTTVARLYYSRQDVDEVEWRVYSPPVGAGAHELVVPDLPAAYDDLDLRTAATGNVLVQLRDHDAISGYDAFRAQPMFDVEGMEMVREGGHLSEGY